MVILVGSMADDLSAESKRLCRDCLSRERTMVRISQDNWQKCSLLCLLYETAHIAKVVQHVSAHGQRGLFAKCRQANKGGTASNFAL